MVSPEERALTKASADLTKYLRHCALEITDLLFAKELVPEDLHMKVSGNSNAVRDVVICLIGRVKNNPGEFVDILEVLEEVSSLSSISKALRKSYIDFGGTLSLPPLPPVPRVQEGVQPAMTPAITTASTNTSKATTHSSSLLPLGYKSGMAVLFLVVAVACYYGLSDRRTQKSDPPNSEQISQSLLHKVVFSECHKLRSGDRKGLEKYLNRASESEKDSERLCKDYLLLENCNALQRGAKLDPFYLAKSYLEQKPGACWEDIVSMFYELSKNTLALEVAEEYHVDTRHYLKPKV